MKKLIAMIASLAIGSSVFAIELGAVGGLSFNNMKVESSSKTTQFSNVIGGKFGAAVEIPLLDVLSVQPEVLFHLNNGGYTDNSFTILGVTTKQKVTVTFNTIEFPVLAKANLKIGSGKLSALVGPTFNILIGEETSKIETTTGNTTENDTTNNSYDDLDWNTFVVGLEIGAEYSFKAGPGSLAIGCMVDFDLGDIAKSDDYKRTRFAITPQLTYFFGL